ncbi:MAG: hypothetical protein C4529_02800 [Deltaproteobacteria bacterium]|nr:MAG: hypothetical protein C4529_02800 [Deltaproteobacteria bacterium]
MTARTVALRLSAVRTGIAFLLLLLLPGPTGSFSAEEDELVNLARSRTRVLFAGLVSFGSRSIGQVYDRMRQVEHRGRRLTGIVFLLAGIYYSMIYIFEVG